MTDDLRKRLLSNALDMVASDGVAALTLRAIARRSGVSHGAPLRHFPSRAALLSAVAAEGYHLATAWRSRALEASDGTPRGRLRAAAEAYVDFALAHPGLYGLMSRPDLIMPTDPVLSQASRPFYEHGVALVTDRQTHDRWHSGLDSRLLAATLWASLHGFTQLWLLGAVTRTSHSDSFADALSIALATLDL